MQKETRPAGAAAQGEKSLFKRIYSRLRANPRLEWTVYGGLALLVALLYAGTLLPQTGKVGDEPRQTLSQPASPDTEARLTEVLSRIRGAGRVEVMITYETGTELVPAMTTSVDSNTSETNDGDKSSVTSKTTESSQPATLSGSGGEPIVLLEREPVVRGVIVVAEGAADIRVKLDLQRAVCAVLDVPASKIEVFESAITGA